MFDIFKTAIIEERDRQSAVCTECPKRCGNCQLTLDGKFHSGTPRQSIVASVRVLVNCDAVNGQPVRPETRISDFTECSRYKRAERKAEVQQVVDAAA